MVKEDNIKEETHSQQDPSDNKSFKREHYMKPSDVRKEKRRAARKAGIRH